MTPALLIEQLQYRWPGTETAVLDIQSLRIEAGESVFLAGPSGSGKSTLLSLIAGVMLPQQGRLEVFGEALPNLSAAQRDRFRADHLGVIFQQFNLLPWLSVLDNVLLPCRFSARRKANAEAADGDVRGQARRLLGRLGLDAERILHSAVNTLSVGQQQRVAAARALMGAPNMVIADEPTSALDADRRRDFIALLGEQCRVSGAALLFVSHDQSLAAQFDRRLSLAQLNRAAREVAV